MQLLPLRKPIYSKLIRLQCVMLNRFIKNKIATQKNTAQQRAVFFLFYQLTIHFLIQRRKIWFTHKSL